MGVARANNGQWQPGQSGNPAGLPGRPLGSRTAFFQGFTRDLAEVWQAKGEQTECGREYGRFSKSGSRKHGAAAAILASPAGTARAGFIAVSDREDGGVLNALYFQRIRREAVQSIPTGH